MQAMNMQATNINEIEFWQAVCDRDSSYNGKFFFAVRTTGVYCKPSCPARQPHRQNVEFFSTGQEAERAGYRACKRCHPQAQVVPEANRPLIEQICQVIAESEQPLSLGELSDRFHLSPYHLQRTFKRIVGVSPKQYAAAIRTQRLKSGLQTALPKPSSVTQTFYEAGYQSNSSFYEQATRELGMTPTAYRGKGNTLPIRYTTAHTPLGEMLVAATDKGICAVRLGDSQAALESTLRSEFAAAQLQKDEGDLQQSVQTILAYLDGKRPNLELPVDVQATAFQRRVWDALGTIPYGETRSYRQVAEAIGQPNAVRAVARACASNSVALVIPCHRVVRENGDLSGYRWGVERKQKLLTMEKQ